MPEPTLPILPIAELLSGKEPPVSWLVNNLLPRGSLIALAGEPGAGKSFVSYTLSLCLASGVDFLGFGIESPAKVLYFDQENSRPDTTQYLRWSWIGLNRPTLPQIESNLAIAHFALGTHDWLSKAQSYVLSVKPELIIIDTATPALAIDDENDNGEAAKAIGKLRTLQGLLSPSPAIIVLKHAKVKSEDGAYTLRGAKAWEGQVDGIIYQIRSAGNPRLDGLRSTSLVPAKTRAFGLRDTVKINPEWTEERAGLRLSRK